MENNNDNKTTTTLNLGLESATELSPLELNNIRLDVRHTILTPDYLESLKNSKN